MTPYVIRRPARPRVRPEPPPPAPLSVEHEAVVHLAARVLGYLWPVDGTGVVLVDGDVEGEPLVFTDEDHEEAACWLAEGGHVDAAHMLLAPVRAGHVRLAVCAGGVWAITSREEAPAGAMVDA